MCCVFATLVFLGPRVGILIWWLVEPLRWQLAFNSFVWPILGVIFLPWTTLMYVMVAPGGVTGFNWFWVILAVVADIASYSGSVYGNRDRIPSYTA